MSIVFGAGSSVGRAPGCGLGRRGFDPRPVPHAGVVELADTLDLESSTERFGGSRPSTGTIFKREGMNDLCDLIFALVVESGRHNGFKLRCP